MNRWSSPIAAVSLLLSASAGVAQPSDEDLLQSALAAAPPAIAARATVMSWDQRTLRAGTNGWTCLPDVPGTPGDDPMCLDSAWMSWAQAWQSHTPVSIDRVGLAYMLRGGTDASNTDPWATEPAPGDTWVHSGPHVMVIVPNPAHLEGLSTDPGNGGPWVMWKGTPYVHIMMPVGG